MTTYPNSNRYRLSFISHVFEITGRYLNTPVLFHFPNDIDYLQSQIAQFLWINCFDIINQGIVIGIFFQIEIFKLIMRHDC